MRTLLLLVASAVAMLPAAVIAQLEQAPRPDELPAPRAAPASIAEVSATAGTASGIESPIADFVDGVVRATMTKQGIAGVTVAVVDRNHDLLVRGYGDAALAPQRAVDGAATLFRIGSISKTFTYVAAMQLIEAGKLDPDAEANRYLPESLRLADAGYPPVLLRHLMTHTAGFEDSALGHLFARAPDHVLALDDYLAKYRPRRVRPPGLHAVYSNYGVGLLGAIVAQVSREPFEAYVEHHLLAPLGMQHATFREPLAKSDARRVDPTLQAAYSTAFQREQGGYTAKPFEFIGQIAPAGAGSASAVDMARWMRMLLNRGTLDGATILQPATFATLAAVDFRNAPAVGGIAHGFFRERYGRYESLEHAGDTEYFHSNMVTLPEAGIGVFVSTNTDTGRALVADLPRLVIERLLPDARPGPAPAPPADFTETGKRYAGAYLSERRAYSTLEAPLSASTAEVSVTRDGYLVIDAGGESRRYVADGTDSFRAIEDGSHIAFLTGVGGAVTGLASAYGHSVADRVGAAGNPRTLLIALGLVAVLSALALAAAWHRSSARVRVRGGQGATLAAVTAALLWLAFLGLAAVVAATTSDDAALFDYPTTWMRVVVVAAYFAAAASVVALFALGSALRARDWSAWRKLRHGLVVALMLATVILMIRWKVLFAPLGLG
ncbi:serine hydrolase domain-containing protein [Dokdonella soli]|uniref:Serine hydrolase domain-containing protein n=1 Tax=Dokdonella soli TaxID=529810 RepID=A0ABN1ID40_9GAMM